jgi:hypothetical protein
VALEGILLKIRNFGAIPDISAMLTTVEFPPISLMAGEKRSLVN